MVSPVKVEQLKKDIYQQLKERYMPCRIQEALTHKYGNNIKDLKDEDLYKTLQENGMLEEMLSSLSFKKQEVINVYKTISEVPKEIQVHGQMLETEECYLELHVGKGRAFVEHLLEPEPTQGQPLSVLKLHAYFCNQKFSSEPLAAVCEPNFSGNFRFHLCRNQDPVALLALTDTIDLILTKTLPSGENILVSSYCLEWRNVLAVPNFQLAFLLELHGIGVESKVPVGLLDIKLKMMPPLSLPLQKEVISAQISLEKKQVAEKKRLFMTYSKLWWKEYLEIREDHAHRVVKMFSQDENMVVKPITSWIHPLHMGLAIKSPREAAWFVSLISFQGGTHLGNDGSQEIWHSPFTIFCLKSGTCEDHAILLCSLFLGFCLDAYVCLGTDRIGMTYSWVLTFSKERQVIFWDCLTACRYIHHSERDGSHPLDHQHPFGTVDCIFNHKHLFANCQPSNKVDNCSFELRNSSKWKAMSADALSLIPKSTSYSSLNLLRINEGTASHDLEQQLRVLVSEYRTDHGLTTFWDEELCHVLIPSLALYEIRGKTGLCGGDEEFLDAVHRIIPKGHSFKALPAHFLHRQPRKVFLESLKLPLGEEIIGCRGDQVRMAVHVQVYSYPENLVSVWIMYAVKYKQIL